MMRGFCPLHEYEWDKCGADCAAARDAFRRASHQLMDYWRERVNGVRQGHAHPNPGRRFHNRMDAVRRAVAQPMCTDCGERPPAPQKSLCNNCRYQRRLRSWAERTRPAA